MTDAEPKGFDMAEAFDAIEAKQDELLLTDVVDPIPDAPDDVDPPADGPARDENGRFVAKEPKDAPTDPVDPPTDPVDPPAVDPVVDPAAQAPARMPKEIREAWNELPEGVRQALERREEETHRIATKVDRERQIGRHFDTVVAPYKGLIESEGGNPLAAVADLLETAKVLRTGSAEQKVALLNKVATQFGIDIEQAYYARPDPQLARAQLEIDQRDAKLRTYEAQTAAVNDATVEQQIADFRAGHEHFDVVANEMSQLIEAGICPDLQTAYDRAIYLNESLRSTLIEQAAAKRVADLEAKQVEAAKIAKAKRAAVSPSSASGIAAKPPGSANLSDIDAMSLEYDQLIARNTG